MIRAFFICELPCNRDGLGIAIFRWGNGSPRFEIPFPDVLFSLFFFHLLRGVEKRLLKNLEQQREWNMTLGT
jgi:hypothetical protein